MANPERTASDVRITCFNYSVIAPHPPTPQSYKIITLVNSTVMMVIAFGTRENVQKGNRVRREKSKHIRILPGYSVSQ